MICTLNCQNYLSKVAKFPAAMPDKSIKTVEEFSEKKYAVSAAGVATIVLGGGKEMRMNKYKPVSERPRCDTDELKKTKFEVRKKRKLDRRQQQQVGGDQAMPSQQGIA